MRNPIRLYRQIADELDRLNDDGFALIEGLMTGASLVAACLLMALSAATFGE